MNVVSMHCGAVVERLYSAHSLIHSDQRNRLNVDHIRWEMYVRRANHNHKSKNIFPAAHLFHTMIGLDQMMAEDQEIEEMEIETESDHDEETNE